MSEADPIPVCTGDGPARSRRYQAADVSLRWATILALLFKDLPSNLAYLLLKNRVYSLGTQIESQFPKRL